MRDLESLIFQTLLNSAVPVAIFLWRPEENWPVQFVSPNVHHVLGYSQDDFLSGRVVYAEIIHPEDLPRVVEEVVRYRALGVPTFEHQDYRVIDPQGRVRWVRDHTAIIRDGEELRYCGYIVDNTARHEALAEMERARRDAEEATQELRRTQEHLIQSEKLAAMGTLAAGISHELTNPMTTVLLNAQLLLRQVPAASPLHDPLATIEAQTRRCRDIIRMLLDYARHKPHRMERVSVTKLIESLGALVRSQARGREICVQVPAGPLPEIEVSVPEFEMVLLNLITNALDATPAGGRVSLAVQERARAGQAGIEVEVADTGCGIPESVRPHIFEPFFTTKPPGAGTGLGLALTQRMVTRARGHIDVESAPGRGTTMRVWLPLALEP